MNNQSESLITLNAIIDREIERHPHNQALLEAFRPVLIERTSVLEKLQPMETVSIVPDEVRFRSGVPIMSQQQLFKAHDPCDDIALAMMPALQKSFPKLNDDLASMEVALRGGKMVLFDFFKANPQVGEVIMDAWAKSFFISVSAIGFVLRQVSRVILEKKARGLADLIKDVSWEKGYCPICGAFPSIAMIKEKLGERLLHCSSCGHDWRFSRVICPYCEHEGQEGMNFFFVEDKAQESVYTCDHCQRYLITLSRMSDLNDRDLEVSALSLVHLDVIMQQKHFSPMTVTDWNVF